MNVSSAAMSTHVPDPLSICTLPFCGRPSDLSEKVNELTTAYPVLLSLETPSTSVAEKLVGSRIYERPSYVTKPEVFTLGESLTGTTSSSKVATSPTGTAGLEPSET